MVDRTRLRSAFATEVNGWIRAHVEGSPYDMGYQNGVLLGARTSQVLERVRLYVPHAWDDWAFFRRAARELYQPKLPDAIGSEIEGTLAGMRDSGEGEADFLDLLALNGYFDTSYSYFYYLKASQAAARGETMPPMNEHGGCSAFAATGGRTADGGFVLAHNTWFPYLIARWNVLLDAAPDNGRRFMMQCYPGTVYSGTDFYLNDAGLAVTETTITGLFTFRPEGVPYFVRAREAIQHATTPDEWRAYMLRDSNGGYANDWIVADAKTSQLMMLELGTNHHRTWRTQDGYFTGCNVARDPEVRMETAFDYEDAANCCNTRLGRWEDLLGAAGQIDAEFAKAALADHHDPHSGEARPSRSTLCGHVDSDGTGLPEWEWGPYYPGGSLDGIVTTAALTREGKVWAHWGKPCGETYLWRDHVAAHPEYAWQAPLAEDLIAYPWTLFSAGW